MRFYICGYYIYTDGDEKDVERNMYAALLYFQGSNDHDEYEKWKNQLEDFFKYFSLTPEQKCHYAQLKLAGEAYWWWEDNHIDCREWFILQDSLRTRYAPHLERPQFSDLVVEYKKILAGMVKTLKSKMTEVVDSPESRPEIDDKPEPGP